MRRMLDRRADNWKPELQNIVIILDITFLSVLSSRIIDYSLITISNVKILTKKPCYRKRLIPEVFNIKKHKNNLNLQMDTEGLYKAYLPIVNKVWLFWY